MFDLVGDFPLLWLSMVSEDGGMGFSSFNLRVREFVAG